MRGAYHEGQTTPNGTTQTPRVPTALESVLLYNRTSVVVPLVAAIGVSWLWIVVMARDMYGPMTGASAWTMTGVWDLQHMVLLWAMWAVMMAGMMLPSAAPMLLLYGALRRAEAASSSALHPVYSLAAGYLVVWAVFSLGATVLQRLLTGMLLVSPMMEVTSPRVGGALLAIAGVYQFTPVKLSCLRACQSPLGSLMRHWRTGWGGAFRMGLAHGALCVGCCWALMLLLFAGGVMNLAVIAALTVFVAFEKLTPIGVHSARVSGVLLIVAAVWMLVP